MNRSHDKGKNFWGPPIWKTVHIFAATLSPNNAEEFKDFLWSLTKLIPCEDCRKNLTKKLKTHPPDPYLRNNHDAFFYSYMLHDLANQHISRYHPTTPKKSPPFDEVKSYYFSALGQECKDCNV